MNDQYEILLNSNICPRCKSDNYDEGYCNDCPFWLRGGKNYNGSTPGLMSFSTNKYKVAVDLNTNTTRILNHKDHTGGTWEYSRCEMELKEALSPSISEEDLDKYLILK